MSEAPYKLLLVAYLKAATQTRRLTQPENRLNSLAERKPSSNPADSSIVILILPIYKPQQDMAKRFNYQPQCWPKHAARHVDKPLIQAAGVGYTECPLTSSRWVQGEHNKCCRPRSGQQTLNSLNLFILKLLFIKSKICTVSRGSCCLPLLLLFLLL